jgi:Protein of unknown function (DUF1499)
MKKVLRMLAWLLAIIVLLVLGVAGYIYLPGGADRLEARFVVPPQSTIDFATLKKVAKPNQYLVCPADLCAEKPDEIAKTYALTPAELLGRWQSLVSSQKDTSVLIPEDGRGQITFVQRTARMRYPDIITVQVLAADAGATHAIYSRSVYGHGDMGVNKARITSWLAQLDQ